MKEELLNTELHDCLFIAMLITAVKEKEAHGTVRCASVNMRKIIVQAKIERRLEVV